MIQFPAKSIDRRNVMACRNPSRLLQFLLCAAIVCIMLIGQVIFAPHVRSEPNDLPNIILILADDMGYGDLGCTGSQHLQTPHLDSLADRGVLCSQAYVASPVCSPSRAGLLTGRDPRRFGYEGNLNQNAANYATRPELLGLPTNEYTIADHLRSAGYATAIVGKWHLGKGERFHPNSRGFDYFCGMQGGSHSYFPTQGKHQIEENGVAVTEFSNDYLTDYFTDQGINWARKRNADFQTEPWFLFLSYNAPHTPMQAAESDLQRFEYIADPKRRTYAAMMFALDRSVGRITDFLKETNQLDDTLICFLSDNGGATNNKSWNGPLSGTKGTLREGGIRVPMIWSWPSTLPVGQSHAGVVSSLDLLPTFMAAAKAGPLPLQDPMSHQDKRNRMRAIDRYGAHDGVDLLSQLSGKAEPQQRRLFWRLQGQTAVLLGDDKLIALSHRPPQLFRPGVDLAESDNRFDNDRETAKALFEELGLWQSRLSTVPLWGSSPTWSAQSAAQYDGWEPGPEPK